MTWLRDPLSNIILVIVGMYVTNLCFLKNKSLCFMELKDGDIKESNKIRVGLNRAAIIPKTDNQNLPNLIDLEVKSANKKKEKAERH